MSLVYTDEFIAAQVFSFFFAGFETTASLVSTTSYLLARHPEIQEKLRNEINETIINDEYLKYDTINSMKYLDMVYKGNINIHETLI